MNINQDQIDQLRVLEKHLRLASELDWEATVDGCGISAYEAIPVMNYVLEILNLERINPTQEEIAEAEESEEY